MLEAMLMTATGTSAGKLPPAGPRACCLAQLDSRAHTCWRRCVVSEYNSGVLVHSSAVTYTCAQTAPRQTGRPPPRLNSATSLRPSGGVTGSSWCGPVPVTTGTTTLCQWALRAPAVRRVLAPCQDMRARGALEGATHKAHHAAFGDATRGRRCNTRPAMQHAAGDATRGRRQAIERSLRSAAERSTGPVPLRAQCFGGTRGLAGWRGGRVRKLERYREVEGPLVGVGLRGRVGLSGRVAVIGNVLSGNDLGAQA
jgi:hypothetical protein